MVSMAHLLLPVSLMLVSSFIERNEPSHTPDIQTLDLSRLILDRDIRTLNTALKKEKSGQWNRVKKS
jgi:hypothetical protein